MLTRSSAREYRIIDSGIDAAHEDLAALNDSGLNLFTKTDDSGSGDAFVDGCGWAYSSDLAAAAYACGDAGARVINMSLGCSGGRGGPFSCADSTEEAAFQDLHDNFGVLSIAAAGNDGNTAYSYPASYPVVMSVAAVDDNKVVASFSQQNDQVDVAAPGVGVLSTVPTGTGFNVSVTDDLDGDGFEASAMQNSTLGSASGTLVDCGDAGAFTAGVACAGAGGQICLIERGSISFEDKVLNCEAGGGSAAVIHNNVSGMVQGTRSTPTATSIPAVGVSQDSGITLTGRVGNPVTVMVDSGHYDFYNGASMATPHVASACNLDGNPVAVDGSVDVSPSPAGAYEYTLNCSNSTSSASDTVTVTVESGGDTGGSITVNGSGSKYWGTVTVVLEWSGATSANVDKFRDGDFVTTTANDGAGVVSGGCRFRLLADGKTKLLFPAENFGVAAFGQKRTLSRGANSTIQLANTLKPPAFLTILQRIAESGTKCHG